MARALLSRGINAFGVGSVEVTVPSPQVVSYRVDDNTVAQFEIEPMPGFVPAGGDRVAGMVQEAIGPAVETAKVLLERLKQLSPHAVEVRFGVRVTGTTSWIVAKAATEGSFEVTLSWQPGPQSPNGG